MHALTSYLFVYFFLYYQHDSCSGNNTFYYMYERDIRAFIVLKHILR